MWFPGGYKEKAYVYIPPTWSEGTDEEIVEALEKHYNNEIDLTEYWSIGDERTVSLSAMSAYSPLTETHDAQDVTLVLLNVGRKELVTPINEHTECVFIVGQKNCLTTKGLFNNSSKTTGWNSSDRRGWCNNTYYNAIPSSIRSIFKLHNNYVSDAYNATTSTKSEDYFCLPSEKEITGSVSGASSNAEANNFLLTYYETAANRIKQVSGTNSAYWTSSKYYYTSSTTSYRQRMDYIKTDGTVTYDRAYASGTTYGLAPQGVI